MIDDKLARYLLDDSITKIYFLAVKVQKEGSNDVSFRTIQESSSSVTEANDYLTEVIKDYSKEVLSITTEHVEANKIIFKYLDVIETWTIETLEKVKK